MGNADLATLRLWLLQSTGLQANLLGPQRLERAVAQRLKQRGCAGPEAYRQLLLSDPSEQQELLEGLVVGESWFLREPRSFDQLRDLSRRQVQRPLRLLSCGCSGGEEPYSMVIALLEAGVMPQQLQVEAIDISALALERAARALYGSHSLRGMDPARLARHFLPEERRWRLRPEIRAAVRFHCGSLQRQLGRLSGGWHAVFCRNVMLYLDGEARQLLLRAIAELLAPDGMLVVAAAEAPMLPAGRFRRLDGGHGAAFQLLQPAVTSATAGPIASPLPAPPPPRRWTPSTMPAARTPAETPAVSSSPSTAAPPPSAGTRSAAPSVVSKAALTAESNAAEAPPDADQETLTPAPGSMRPPADPIPSASLEPTVHLDLARRLHQQRRPQEALLALRRCLYLEPGHLEAMELGAALARELGLVQEAERQVGRLQRSRQRRQP